MSMSINKAVIAGNVGNDPEIRKTQQGKDVANFSVATNEKWKDKQTGELKERTEWHKVVVWGALVPAVIEKYVRKGQSVYLEGEIRTRSYDQDGVKKYSTEIHLQGPGSVFKLNGRMKDSEGTAYLPPTEAPAQADPMEDEIPF